MIHFQSAESSNLLFGTLRIHQEYFEAKARLHEEDTKDVPFLLAAFFDANWVLLSASETFL